MTTARPWPADGASDWCPIGSLSLHTSNYENTECIWCGPNALAWKPGKWVDIGGGFNAWSVELSA